MSTSQGQGLISFEEALQLVLQHTQPGEKPVEVPITAAAGFVLAEDVTSGIEMPPFNKAAMDGFAFRHADTALGNTFRVVATLAAGEQRDIPLREGECVQIMTGAPAPTAADTVIPVEDTGPVPAEDSRGGRVAETVCFHAIPARGGNLALQGEDMRRGAVALKAGHLIHHQEVAVLAAVGRRTVKIYPGPSIAFAPTGEELAEPGEEVRPGMIFNSNAYSLWSQILHARAHPHYMGILRDDVGDLREKIREGLKHDMLVLSGGVSMGKYDLVPGVFKDLGVRILFHKLLVKPGKPTLFGVRDRTLVFGLAGNPVSTLYAFDQFVAPAIRGFRRHPRPQGTRYHGIMTATIEKETGRLQMLPCMSEWDGERFLLTPVKTHGSADIFAIAGADALAFIPAGVETVREGQPVRFRKLYEE